MSVFDKLISERIKRTNEMISSLSLDDSKKDQIKNHWLDSILLMEHLTKKHYLRYNYLNLITIVGGVLIPVVINLLPQDSSALVTTFLGVTVSIAAGINQSYRFNDRWRHFRLISEELKIEGELFFALGEKYQSFITHNNEAFKLFITNVESIKKNQIDTYMKKVIIAEVKQSNKQPQEE
jgi:hypothetical protein